MLTGSAAADMHSGVRRYVLDTVSFDPNCDDARASALDFLTGSMCNTTCDVEVSPDFRKVEVKIGFSREGGSHLFAYMLVRRHPQKGSCSQAGPFVCRGCNTEAQPPTGRCTDCMERGQWCPDCTCKGPWELILYNEDFLEPWAVLAGGLLPASHLARAALAEGASELLANLPMDVFEPAAAGDVRAWWGGRV